MLHKRWGWAPRSRRTRGGFKPPTAAALKRRGGERVGKWPDVRFGQVRFAESNEGEPLMRCRKKLDDVKTGGPLLPRDEFGSDVRTARAASGIKVARTRIRLLCGTWEPVIPMQRENLMRKHREGERTEAEYRGGATRSSAEGPGMGLERRGCPIQSGSLKQLATG